MSGRWSRACDEQSVGDSHRSPARSAQLALTYIAHALIAIEDGEDPRWAIERAGAYVRAWRKSLPEQSRGEQRPPTTTARGTLLQSGHWVLSAVASTHPDMWLAETEAALRLAWKQATR